MTDEVCRSRVNRIECVALLVCLLFAGICFVASYNIRRITDLEAAVKSLEAK